MKLVAVAPSGPSWILRGRILLRSSTLPWKEYGPFPRTHPFAPCSRSTWAQASSRQHWRASPLRKRRGTKLVASRQGFQGVDPLQFAQEALLQLLDPENV